MTLPKLKYIYLIVPYEDKELAKSLGAYWSPEKKLWYCPRPRFQKQLLSQFEACEYEFHEKNPNREPENFPRFSGTFGSETLVRRRSDKLKW